MRIDNPKMRGVVERARTMGSEIVVGAENPDLCIPYHWHIGRIHDEMVDVVSKGYLGRRSVAAFLDTLVREFRLMIGSDSQHEIVQSIVLNAGNIQAGAGRPYAHVEFASDT